MSVDVRSNPYTASVPDASHYPVARSSVKELSTQQPKVTDKGDERHKRMVNKTSYLWAGFEGNAYDEVVDAIVNQWTESGLPDKKFLEKAVDLLVDFQNRQMKNMKDSLEWSQRLKESGIDSKRYLAWVDEQYERLAREKHKGFDDITLEKFSLSLILADWKDANDDSAIVNAYLLKAEPSLKPEIYLGCLGKSRLAVRVNGECLRPQKTDFHTADSHGVTAINPDILLEMRYVPLKSDESKKTMLFIPIGNVYCMGRSRDLLTKRIFAEGKWQDTGIVLVLRISKKEGTPLRLYMVKDLKFRNSKVGEDDKGLWDRLEENPFTLAEIEDKDKHDLTPYNGISERPTPRLKSLSVSKLEIVQTGEKGDWSEGVFPVGLYPIDQDLEGS